MVGTPEEESEPSSEVEEEFRPLDWHLLEPASGLQRERDHEQPASGVEQLGTELEWLEQLWSEESEGRAEVRRVPEEEQSVQSRVGAIRDDRPAQQEEELPLLEVEVRQLKCRVPQLEEASPQLEVRVGSASEQLFQLPEQSFDCPPLHGHSVRPPALFPRQSLCVEHHPEHRESVRRVLPLSQELAAKWLFLDDLCCEVSTQEELYERHEQLPSPWLVSVERCPVVAELV